MDCFTLPFQTPTLWGYTGYVVVVVDLTYGILLGTVLCLIGVDLLGYDFPFFNQ